MRIGVPRETKDGEARVGATPEMVRAFVARGHAVQVEAGAGLGSGFGDGDYAQAGAELTPSPDEVFACDLVIKVKELQKPEYGRLRRGSIVAGYQQLARDQGLLQAVLDAGITCLAYESVTTPDGSRPLLLPMSLIAGTMTAQIAAWALQRREGPLSGSGVLLPALPGLPGARVLVIGDGTVGQAAMRTFLRLGCAVTVLGLAEAPLRALAEATGRSLGATPAVAVSSREALQEGLRDADVVVGAVAIPGRLSPKLIDRAMLGSMRPGSVFIDVGIDMGGISETSRQTRLSDPLYVEEGVLHYGVPNIPAQVPRTATLALTAATLPCLLRVADRGLAAAVAAEPGLRPGVLVHDGRIVDPSLAQDCGRACDPFLPTER
jgi:alanine dehydrogenase